ncbi:restriction endonuclease subunit S [Shewanella sp. PP-Sp27a-2]
MADLSITNAHAHNIEATPKAENLITTHLDIWTTAIEQKSSAGRGSSKKFSLYGIKKLRELILELAVRGKLVPQASREARNSANYEPASVLLERIAAEKAQLVKEEKLKKQKPLPEIREDEKSFELPQGWAWSRLGDIATASTGYAFKSSQYTDNGTFVLRVTNINPDGTIDRLDSKFIDPILAESEFSKFLLCENDILMVMVGGSLGKVGIVSKNVLPAVLNQNMWKLSQLGGIPFPFFKCILEFINKNQITITASTHGHLAQGDYLSKLVPTPPLKEQHRIVAKVDELMSLCDALEAQTEASIAAHQTLVETLLNALLLPQATANTASQSDISLERPFTNRFDKDWQRVAEHFDTLFTTAASIDTLKQTILQLAVMGKLVKQDPNDEPAAKLLARIAKEKAQLIKEGKIKKQKPLPAITEEEKPFQLPNGWEWEKCQNICFKITDGEHATPERTESGYYLLSARNVTNEGIILNDVDYVPKHEFERIRKRCDPNIGDVLISCSGSVGRVALVDRDYTYSMVRSAAMIRPCNENLNSQFLAIMLRSPYLQEQMRVRSKQSAQANLFLGAIGNLVTIIPPLEEQHRIVAKVDELMALCDQLKARLADAQTTQLHLTDAIVEQNV